MDTNVIALEIASNGVTIRATQPREFYEGNQCHTLNEKEYTVVLTKEELKAAPDKSLCVTTFITDMSFLLSCLSHCNCDISCWDTSNVVNMHAMFLGARSFNGDISQWDVGNVTNMEYMFYNATSFNGNISQWNTRKVTNMYFMFYYALSFNGDIRRWDTSNVTDMEGMFEDAQSFNCDISSWIIRPDCDTNIMLKGTPKDYYQQRKEDTFKTTETIKEELIAKAWHPKRLIWCLDHESKETRLNLSLS